MRLPSLVVAVLLGGAVAPLASGRLLDRAQSTPTTEARQVQSDVEAIGRGLYRGDVDIAIKYTHPTLLKLLGGAEEARRAVTAAMAPIAELEFKIESLTFPSPPQFFDGGGRRFVFVPTLMVVSSKGARVESLNFQLGILDAGATEWKYAEGSRLTAENVQAFFPGFPKDRPFPPIHRKRIEVPAPWAP